MPQFCSAGHSGHENGERHQGSQLLVRVFSCKKQQAPAMFVFGMDVDLVILGHQSYECMSNIPQL